jgi:hypothetical protein
MPVNDWRTTMSCGFSAARAGRPDMNNATVVAASSQRRIIRPPLLP